MAGLSTIFALAAIFISWLIYGRNPLKTGQLDPLKKPLGPIFIGMENKWFMDEVYQFLIINPYRSRSFAIPRGRDRLALSGTTLCMTRLLLGTYNWLSKIALDRYADQKGIDAVCQLARHCHAMDSLKMCASLQNGFVRSYALAVLLGVVRSSWAILL